jgi:hypothetical protein
LRKRYTDFAQAHPDVLKQPVFPEPPRPLLGRRLQPAAPPTNDREAWVAFQVKTAERILFGGTCRHCHIPAAGPVQMIREPGPPQFERTRILERWLPHASFSHKPEEHQKLQCIECHAAPGSERTADVLLPGVETCRRCHTPATGTRSDCLLCHRYHPEEVRGGKKVPPGMLHPGAAMHFPRGSD